MKQFKRTGLVIATLMLLSSSLFAQNSFNFRCAKDTTIDGCANPCLTLKARIPDVRSSTSDYVINPLTGPNLCGFAPYIAPDLPGNPITLTIDDTYSSVINLPFSFPFYDDAASPYTSLIASTNGFLSFDVSKSGLYSHWPMSAGNVPNTTYDKSLIMGVFHDLNPAYNTSPTQRIKYDVIGLAPHRKFIFSVYKVPQFSCQNLIENTHQIVLYESLGIIEVFVQSVEQCTTWNQNRKMIGLQNANKDKGIMAPGRTATGPSWGTPNMNETWRFVPAAGPSLFRGVELYDLNGVLVATGDTAGIGSGTLEVSFPNVCPAGTTTYVVKSKYAVFNNPNAFVYGTDTVTVISNNPLSATSAVSPATCATAGIGTAAVFVTGAPGPFEYSSDNGVTWQTSSVFNLPPGTYTIKYRIIGTTCSGTTQVVVAADPNLVAGNYDVNNVLCNGGSTGSINITGLNGTGVYEYSIDGGVTFQSSGTFSNLPVGTYNIRIRDNAGCFRDTVIVLAQPSVLSATAAASNASCSATPNGSIIVEAAGGTSAYEYSIDGTTFQSNPVFNVYDGTYTVTIRDANGCTTTLSQVVGLTNDLFVSTRNDTTLCLGASLALTTNSAPGASFSWTGTGLDNPSAGSPVCTPTGIGLFTYSVTATLGQCTATDEVSINVDSQVQVDAGNDQSIIRGESVQLNGSVSGAPGYLWTSNPSDATLTSTTILNPVATPNVTTTYTLTATNAAGCFDTDEITITVIPYCIKVKNAFSPNGDGINDKWQIYDQYDCLSNITLTVFNRYGSRVFETRDYRNDWDGTYKGKPVPDGTYYSVIEFKLISGKKFTTKTDVTIVR